MAALARWSGPEVWTGAELADDPDWAVSLSAGEVAELVKDVRTKKGPVFRLVKVMVEKLEFVMPPQDGAHLKDRFRQALLGHP